MLFVVLVLAAVLYLYRKMIREDADDASRRERLWKGFHEKWKTNDGPVMGCRCGKCLAVHMAHWETLSAKKSLVA